MSFTRTHTETIEEQFYGRCLQENYRQVDKWGIQHHTVHEWLTILTEELGEVAKASIEGSVMTPDVAQVRRELEHVAAVCAAIVADESWQS